MLVENLKVGKAPVITGHGDIDIAGLSLDSRTVGDNYLFAAINGEVSDGRDFIPSAIENGANAILLSTGSPVQRVEGVSYVEHENPRKVLAQLAGLFYQPKPEQLFAITGTNGKTSVASFVRQILHTLGENAASMGTMGVESNVKVDGLTTNGLTTPDTVQFHQNLSALAKANVNNVIFEASSHGLEQSRLDGVKIVVAGFTNLSREHLDYHGDMDSYFNAKSRLFTDLLSGGVAVINIDNSWGLKLVDMCRDDDITVLTVGRNDSADVKLLSCVETQDGYGVQASYKAQTYEFNLALVGDFQVENAMLAAAMVIARGVSPEKVFAALATLSGVAGRMELAGRLDNGAKVIIDYAHTPDGLENALGTLQDKREENKLAIVFGCGGNRDAGKRPIMGGVAAKLADRVYITDDNPRDEDPKAIRQEVLASAPNAQEFDDRAVAIHQAVSELNSGDILLVTGKGHEQGQLVAGKVLPFSDLAVVREAIERCNAKNLKDESGDS